MMSIPTPYLLFLGSSKDQLDIKTSSGVAQWRPENCMGEHALEGCEVTLNLPQLSISQAANQGAKTLVIGLANSGGTLSDAWINTIIEALEAGMHIASGLHQKLNSIPRIKECAEKHGRKLFDVRHSDTVLKTGTGKKRTGKRLLTVGTDCSVGKMYTTLAIEKAMLARGMKASFRATGQTGILITGEGIPIDAIVSDFIAGAVEMLSPDNDDDHWDIIEGQGSLYHPAFSGVSLGLLHGAQADALVVCHAPERTGMRGASHYALPNLEETIQTNLLLARRTSPQVKLAGISFNTSSMDHSDALKLCAATAETYNVPCVDPLRMGVDAIIDTL